MKHTSNYMVWIKNLKPMAVVLTRAAVDPSREGAGAAIAAWSLEPQVEACFP